MKSKYFPVLYTGMYTQKVKCWTGRPLLEVKYVLLKSVVIKVLSRPYPLCLNHYVDLSNDILYKVLSSGAPEISNVKLWDFQIYSIN